MLKRILAVGAMVLILLVTAPTHGQLLTSTSSPLSPAGASEPKPVPDVAAPTWSSSLLVIDGGTCPDATAGRVWGDVAYLLWWVKDGPASVPLVTTGSPGNPLGGILGQPDTRVLVGGSGLDYGTFSGLQATFGFWLDTDSTVGLEANGFALERRSVAFQASSDAAGASPLVVPFYDPELAFQTGTIIASPVGQPFSGTVSFSSHTRLWGCQANGVLALTRGRGIEIDLLAGYRHLTLDEDLALTVANRDLTFDIQNRYSDRFATTNGFDGGQLGARIGWHSERLSLVLQGAVALGNTFQAVDRTGPSLQTGADAFAPGPHPGGILVQPTSIGRLTADRFAVVPSAEVRIGVRILPGLTASIGYDFLYWSSVVRPGAQIDPLVNPSQSAISGGGTLIGPARPAPLFQRSDFFAHGVQFALEFQF